MGSLTRLHRSGPTWVYMLRCAHGAVLYVGVTSDLDRRLSQHRSEQSWWHEVARVVAHQFPTRKAALDAEKAAITIKQPTYNVAGVVPNDQFNADTWAQSHSTWSLPLRTVEYQEQAD